MATSALLVEIIVIGLLATVAGIAHLLSWNVVTVTEFQDLGNRFKDQATVCLAFLLSLAYCLGWITNSAAYFLTKFTFIRSVRRRFDIVKNYEEIRTKVFQYVSEANAKYIFESFAAVRISRSVSLLLLLVSPVAFHCKGGWVGLSFLFASALALGHAWSKYYYYVGLIAAGQCVVPKEAPDVLPG